MKLIKTIATQFFTGANIAVIILLWLCCASTYLHPEEAPKLSLSGLLFPFFLFTNIAFIFFWLIFKIKRVWLPLVGLVACWSFVNDYMPINLPSTPPTDALKVITYNTKGFGADAAIDSSGQNRLMSYLKESDADIICLQETYNHKGLYTTFKDEMSQLGYNILEGKQNAIFSRLPIISSDTLEFEASTNSCQMARLLYEGDTVLLFNCHFESDHLSPDIKEAYRKSIKSMEQDSLRQGLMPVARLLAAAAPLRAAQADSIVSLITDEAKTPALVCGDFNDTPVSYTHRILTGSLKSAFCDSGCGVGFSFHEHGFPVRIDHVLFSPSVWKSYNTFVDTEQTYSDHYPLVTYLKRVTSN